MDPRLVRDSQLEIVILVSCHAATDSVARSDLAEAENYPHEFLGCITHCVPTHSTELEALRLVLCYDA